MNSSNGNNNRNRTCLLRGAQAQTVALVISTCALALARSPPRLRQTWTVSQSGPATIAPVVIGRMPARGHPAPASHFSPTTAAQQCRPRLLADKWWCYF